MKKIIFIVCMILLSSCDNFEKRFYQKMDEARASALENGIAYFDLSTVTDFEWDSVFLVRGNESVSVGFYEIDEMLNERKSYIHWEKRIKGEIDTTFRWQTKDLPVGIDRFYFLTPDKKLIGKEIDHRWGFQIYYCDKHISTETDWWWCYDFWLSKQEANFLVFSKEVTSTISYENKNDTVVTWMRVWFEANCTNDGENMEKSKTCN